MFVEHRGGDLKIRSSFGEKESMGKFASFSNESAAIIDRDSNSHFWFYHELNASIVHFMFCQW